MSPAELFASLEKGTIPDRLASGNPLEPAEAGADDIGLPERKSADTPLVSVIIPTYEDAHFLPDSLRSVGAQTHESLEVIIVDSSGVSWVAELASQRNWITYVEQDPAGIAVARNEGIAQSRGDIVAFLDVDDIWHPDYLTRQLAAMGETDACSLSARYHVGTGENAETEIKTRGTHLPSFTDVWKAQARWEIQALPSSFVFRREVVSPDPFVEYLTACEDYAFIVEQFYEHSPSHIPEPLVIYRNRPDSVSSDRRQIYRMTFRAIKHLQRTLPDEDDVLERHRGDIHLKYAGWLANNDEPDRAKRHRVKGHLIKGRLRLAQGDVGKANIHFHNITKHVPEQMRADVYSPILEAYRDADELEQAETYVPELFRHES